MEEFFPAGTSEPEQINIKIDPKEEPLEPFEESILSECLDCKTQIDLFGFLGQRYSGLLVNKTFYFWYKL